MNFRLIAQIAWLTIQYESARESCIKAGVILGRKEWMARPGYVIMVGPAELMAIQESGIAFVQVRQPPAPVRPDLKQLQIVKG